MFCIHKVKRKVQEKEVYFLKVLSILLQVRSSFENEVQEKMKVTIETPNAHFTRHIPLTLFLHYTTTVIQCVFY